MNVISVLQQPSAKNLYKNQGVNYLGLFGSHARGEAKTDSDIDLLIDFDQTKSLFELADISLFLKSLLGQKVDLVDRDSIKKALKPYIEQDLITVYEKE